MSLSQITYNPGILGESELVRSFVVRQKSLDLILEALRENSSSPANRHLLIVGPRGIGKTMLVRRAAAAVHSNPEYAKHWYPIVFGEESYPVSTPGEFWLEAIFHLADQTRDQRIQKNFAELREERDDARLRERALAQLLDFTDQVQARIILIVENLNTLLGEQMDEDAAWELRHTLLNEPRLMLLGTATNRLDEIAHIGHAWFEMFSVHQLQPLTIQECAELWRSVTGTSIPTDPLKAVRILTGGNPRLLKILAAFAANHSFRELMEQLVHLIDDHTEYFKGHLEALAAKERKVFVALLERWDPVVAADLANETRLNVNEVSALLGRLVSRGAVEVVEQKGRKKLYQAAERLYNIYYLMRRRGHPEGRVQAAVQFMITFYKDKELVDRLAELAREACGLPTDIRQDYYRAYIEILRRVEPLKPEILRTTPAEFFHAAGLEVTRMIGMPGLFIKAASLLREGKLEDAEKLCRHLLQMDPKNPDIWLTLGSTLCTQDRWAESEQAFAEAASLKSDSPNVYLCLGMAQVMNHHLVEAEENLKQAIRLQASVSAWIALAFVFLDRNHLDEAIEPLRNALDLDHKNLTAWQMLSHTYYQLNRFEEAESTAREALSLAPTAQNWQYFGSIMAAQDRWAELEQSYQQVVELSPEDAGAWGQLGRARYLLDRLPAAEGAFRRATELDSKTSSHWADLGGVLFIQKRIVEAEGPLRKAIELDAQDPIPWRMLGFVLQTTRTREEAEAFWQKALETHPDELVDCAPQLLALRLARGVEPDIILREAEEWMSRSKNNPEAINGIIDLIITVNLAEGIPLAERWARKIFENQKDLKSMETLCKVLAKAGKWHEALTLSQSMLDESGANDEAREAATDFLIQVAAAGHAKEALEAIQSSKGVAALEPLTIGMQIYLGEDPKVAKEIYEIGSDVADRIRKHAETNETEKGDVNQPVS